SIFTVCIPQRIVNPTPVGKINISSIAADTASYKHVCDFIAPQAKILVVDDVPVNLNVFVNLIKGHKMQVDTASSGFECLTFTRQKKYDIIFMDHMMPEMDGIETLSRIKADTENLNNSTTVIMLTANALIGMKEMYLEKGFTDYLSKPIMPDKLEKKINHYLPDDKKISESDTKDSISADAESIEKTEASSDNSDDLRNKDPLQKLSSLLPDVNQNMAIRYCSGSKEFYIEFLKDFITDGRYDRISKIYENMDVKQYAIEVHTLKGTSRTLGFDNLSEIAEKLQFAADQNDIDSIRNNHNDMMQLYNEILCVLKQIF
ncbi:MAG: response regulator, partial [Oscillospiraceae bacterium]|nr:response regulator [Oscillospiraceae bacterium]